MRKKCPPQEQAFLLTFLALKKVRRLAGRDPPVLTDVTSPKSAHFLWNV
jgi:hypothetical protein